MRLCLCHECSKLHVIDPVTHTLLAGQYLTELLYKEHTRQQNANERGASYLKTLGPEAPIFDLQPGGTPPISTGSPFSGPKSSIPLAPPNFFRKPTMASTPEGELWLSRLTTVDSKLRESDGSSLVDAQDLVFLRPPTRTSPPMLSPSCVDLALEETVPSNATVVDHERWLLSAEELTEECEARTKEDALQRYSRVLTARIRQEQDVILDRKYKQWERLRKAASGMPRQIRYISNVHRVSRPFDHLPPKVLICYIMVAFMHLIAGLSLKYCKFLLRGLGETIALDLSGSAPRRSLPVSVETVISHMNLEPHTSAYACCPKCFALYPYDPTQPQSVPELCSSKRTPSSPACDTLLLDKRNRSKNARKQPVRLFLHHEIDDWIGDLYSRMQIEKLVDRDVEKDCEGQEGEEITDILGSPGIRQFLGPENDPKRPFLKRPGNEGRLLFSLNMDGFNPLMNKESGKKLSVGAVYLVCLHLPASIRYNLENIFLVGIIPGPHEPSKEEINHVISPLVDNLLQLWQHGCYLSSTSHFPHGRLVRAALIPLICDLPAARQMSGFAGHSSRHFCSMCMLKSDDIDNFDFKSWPRRTEQEHRKLAEEWRSAPSEEARDKIFDRTGIRWSQLLRLPYWDPTKYVMIDSMHGFFLRLFQRHCRQIWGMGVNLQDGDYPSFAQDKNRPSDAAMENGYRILRFGNEKKLQGLKVGVLRELARSTDGVPYGGRAKKLVKELLKYRTRRGWFSPEGLLVKLPEEAEAALVAEFLPQRARSDQGLPNNGGPRQKRQGPPTAEDIANGIQTLESGTKSALKKLRKDVLLAVCQAKGILTGDKMIVPELISLLEAWRLKEHIIDFSGNLVTQTPQNPNKSKKGAGVLGKDMLREIREDMDRLQLPAWVAPAPRHPGEAKRGKFTADQWRAFCMINLPITLTRLWGQEPEGSRRRKMLDNFMHLVTAVKMATMRRMSPERISTYVAHMHAYLTGLISLYPGTTISPYQHLSLHFQEFLSRFGPVHAWRCFPFERYNYLLQNINTNSKLGELETTLLLSFTRGQRLKSLIDPEEHSLPSSLDNLLCDWEKILETDIRGTRLGDAFPFDVSFKPDGDLALLNAQKETRLPLNWHHLLNSYLGTASFPPLAHCRTKITRLGETFQTVESSPRDSRVIYRGTQGTSAGLITGIFSINIPEATTFVVVREFQQLPSAYHHLDACRRFSEVAGVLVTQQMSSEHIIRATDILHHFAYIEAHIPDIPWPCIQALPLDR